MSNEPLRVAVIIGSTRQGRFAPTVAKWFAAEAELRDDMTIDVLDLADAGLSDTLSGPRSLEAEALSSGLAEADAFVVVTPEYNHSFPAPLKNAIDWHSKEWQAKPVAFVSYGGMAGGARAVEQLRQVFAELHAVTVRDTVSFHGVWEQFDANGSPKNTERSARAAKTMLDQLAWWGSALREAKSKHPYGT
jgi:NAD(P)H-dependent FMN reductase